MITHEDDFDTWEEFEEHVKELRRSSAPRALVFRGLSDSTWPLTTTLERNGNVDMLFAEYYRVIASAEPQIRTFTRSTWEAEGLDSYEEITRYAHTYGLFKEHVIAGQFRAYGYMAYLRHQGFPSPLLDWTRSPYIAAFFAFRSAVKPPSERVSVAVFCDTMDNLKISSNDTSQIVRFGPYTGAHRRHHLQQGEYTTCFRWQDGRWRFAPHEDVFDIDDSTRYLLLRFNIPWSERLKVLQLLDDYNVNAFSLFESDEALLETIALRELTFRQ